MPDRVKASSVQMTDDTDELPSWDTTPIQLRYFLNSMPEYVEDIDPDLVTLVERGYVMEKSTAVAPTKLHAIALRDNAVHAHTFENPIPYTICKDTPIPRGVAPLTASDEKSVKVGLLYWTSKDRKLMKVYLNRITVRAARKKWKKKCKGSGLRLLALLNALADEVGPQANTAIAAMVQKLVNTGPDERKVASFNLWKEALDTWNESQSEEAVIPGARRLGEPIAHDISMEIRVRKCRGDADAVADAINSVLSEYEAEQLNRSAAGGGLSAADPRMSGLAPTRTGTPGGNVVGEGGERLPNDPCETCTAAGIKGDAAMHWHRKCPIRQKNREEKEKKKKEKKFAKKAAKAAKLAADAGNDDKTTPPAASPSLVRCLATKGPATTPSCSTCATPSLPTTRPTPSW